MSDKLLPHIQIIRGLSILLVLLFHLGLPWAGSGYLGVDVFFVISGFLMAFLYGDLPTRQDVLRFYAKRLWRLLPAYIAMLVVTVIVAAAFFSLPSELSTVVDYGLWSAALMPNIGFWTDTSYFEATIYRPFLHFWSLGVELQYYLLFPVVAWLLRRRPWLVVALALVTLAGFVVANVVSQKSAFFLTPFRLWEFLAGVAAARIMPHVAGRWPSAGLATIAGMLAWMLIFSDTQKNSTPHTVVIVLLTAAAIALGLPSAINDSMPGRLLQRLGTYSYSIYLVHFPVIVFWGYEPFGGTGIRLNQPWDYAAVTAMTIALGILLHHTVEQPFRHPRALRPLVAGLAASAAVVFAAGLAFEAVKERMMPANQYKIAASLMDRDEWRCGKWARLFDPLADSCRLTPAPATDRGVLLVGNSHADAIKTEVARATAAGGATMWLMTENYAVGVGYRPEQVIAEASRRRVGLIMLHSRWDAVKPQAIEALTALALPFNIGVAVVDPVPNPRTHVPATLLAAARSGKPVPKTIGDIAGYEADNQATLAAIDALAVRYPNLKRYPVAGVFCAPECRVVDEEDRPLYFDYHHLTLTGATWLRPALTTAIAQKDGAPPSLAGR